MSTVEREAFRERFKALLLEAGVYFPDGDGCIEAHYDNVESMVFEALGEESAE